MRTMLESYTECLAGCGNLVPFNGYCRPCQQLAEEFHGKEPLHAPGETFRRMARRHNLFGSLPRTDVGIVLRRERRARIARRLLTLGLMLCSAVMCGLAGIGGWTVLRWFLAR